MGTSYKGRDARPGAHLDGAATDAQSPPVRPAHDGALALPVLGGAEVKGLRPIRSLAIVVFCAVLLNASALLASAATSVPIAGYEIFPGIRQGTITYGATFAGRADTTGSWIASVNYSGTAGLGHTVAIVGGRWYVRWQGVHYGVIINGLVVWPPDLATDLGFGCGAGVATFGATLSGGGSITGCLDDTHLSTVFPPTIVGTLTLP